MLNPPSTGINYCNFCGTDHSSSGGDLKGGDDGEGVIGEEDTDSFGTGSIVELDSFSGNV